jgi:gliding motility-associated-like protein
VLCTGNNFGCTSIDTINFEIRDNEQLEPFLFEPDSCGSLTINFNELPNNLGDNAFWDFGDGNTGSGSLVSNTYDQPGVYTVTLSDSSSVCSKLPVILDVNVPNLEIEILGADTIFYESNTQIDILAQTTGDNQDITWCLEDGTNIGTGNPLEDFIPSMDTVIVIAKVIDEFGCEESDSVILILDDEIDAEDCLESVIITGPVPSVVCVNEEFQLNLLMDEDCDLEDFNYDWGPTDCIVSGNGTPNVTVSAEETKTIMVIVTHIESGIDSMYFYDIEVSNPQVDISVPEINIDANGQPFVCLGQSIVLSVNPEDLNCNYTWSNGQTGSEIEFTPEETVTISVFCEDDFGCSSEESSVTIPVVLPECNENDVYLPNAFSPNGDSANDVLFVRSKFIEKMELSITNRWGEQVFLSTDQSVGWDGTYKGKALAPDVFAYCVKVTCISGDEYIKAGNVSIIK